MPLKLNDLIDKASKKGFQMSIKPKKNVFIKPWQSESAIYIDNQKKEQDFIVEKLTSNRDQTRIKPKPNRNQTETKLAPEKIKVVPNRYQSNNKTDIKTDIKVVPNQYQTNTKIGFFSLAGLQKEITIFIYNLCKISRDKKTDAVSISHISLECKSTVGAVKVAIRRLIEKEIIHREEFKNGRGGWTVYSIPNDIYQEIISTENDGKLVSNWYQTSTKLMTELVSKVTSDTSSSSSSSLNIIKTTTTDEPENNELNPEWLEIDFECLTHIGFTKTHLKQLATQKIISAEQVQNSIYAFAFDLEHNNKLKEIKGNPINFFMGILRKGMPYTFPANYESPKDREMRLYAERLEELEQKRVARKKEVFNLAFKDWFHNLSEEEARKILPVGFKFSIENKITEEYAKEYFAKKVWVNN